MLSIHEGPLPTCKLYGVWEVTVRRENFGAFSVFTGLVRDEERIQGLSFDLYEPILKTWFEKWQADLSEKNAHLFMAHSQGDVPLHESSFMAAVASPKRRVSLEMLDAFVEDFKANAPIWKYDLIDGERIFAADRCQKLPGSGLLTSGGKA